MSQVAQRPLTFEEFTTVNTENRFELVDGRLEELVAARPLHGWTMTRLSSILDPYLEENCPGGFWGADIDVPTIAFHGRRPDFLFYSAADAAAGITLEHNQVTGRPTLAVEIVSPDDEERDTVIKRREYAQAGIPHYWILDPQQRTAVTLELRGNQYEETGRFTGQERLSSSLFPGLEIPLRRLFR